MISFEEAKEALGSRGLCSKVVKVGESAECLLVACRRDDSVMLIAFGRHDDWIYAKMVPEGGLPSSAWTCSNVYYTPYGVYVFGRSLSEIVDKLAAKLVIVKAQERIVEQKLVSGYGEA